MGSKHVKWRVWCEDDTQWEQTAFVPLSDGKPTLCPVDEGHTITDAKSAVIESRGFLLSKTVAFTSASGPYIPTSSSSYVVVGQFPIIGVKDGNDAFRMKCIVSASGSTPTMAIRIRDITNNLNIVEKTGITFTSPDSPAPRLVDLGALANLPDEEAILSVRIKKTAGSGQVRISSFSGYD